MSKAPRTPMSDEMRAVLRHLRRFCNGPKWASTKDRIALDLAMIPRQVEACVCALRREPHCEPIGSGTHGYWYATDPSQLDAVIERQRNRAIEAFTTRRGLRQARRRLRAQTPPTQRELFRGPQAPTMDHRPPSIVALTATETERRL